MHIHIDPFSGIAGDMFLGALVHLGLSPQLLEAALAKLPIGIGYRISAQTVLRRGITAVDLKVRVLDPDQRRTTRAAQGADGGHQSPNQASPGCDRSDSSHCRGYHDLLTLINHLDTPPRVRERAGHVVSALAEAEARVHGKSVDQIHFHEVGAVDSIVDLLGSVVGLELLTVDSLSCGPLPVSRGLLNCAHGTIPVPAPATAELMRGIPIVGVDREGELVTPTGAALVVGLGAAFGPPPPMTIKAIGYGAGDRDDPGVPNLLRLMLGELTQPPLR